jgi:NADH:ubiquinone reductase (H+-translocating)
MNRLAITGLVAGGAVAAARGIEVITGVRATEVTADRVKLHDGREIGDSAAIPQVLGGLAPPTAQAAVQEGRVAARNVLAAIDGRQEDMVRFEYRPLGVLVELGSRFAVNDVMGVRFSGLAAALFWRAVYLSKLESPQNKVRVAADWILGLFFRPAATEIRDLA